MSAGSSSSTRSTAKGTTAAGGTTVLATGLVWLLGRSHVDLSAEAGVGIAGSASTVVVFVWHYGVRNILHRLWWGDGRRAVTSH